MTAVEARSVLQTVRARPRRLSALSVSRSKSFLYALLYGRVGRLTSQNGGSRPGQVFAVYESAKTGVAVKCLPLP